MPRPVSSSSKSQFVLGRIVISTVLCSHFPELNRRKNPSLQWTVSNWALRGPERQGLHLNILVIFRALIGRWEHRQLMWRTLTVANLFSSSRERFSKKLNSRWGLMFMFSTFWRRFYDPEKLAYHYCPDIICLWMISPVLFQSRSLGTSLKRKRGIPDEARNWATTIFILSV